MEAQHGNNALEFAQKCMDGNISSNTHSYKKWHCHTFCPFKWSQQTKNIQMSTPLCDLTNYRRTDKNARTVIVGFSYLAQNKCARSSSRRCCDGAKLATLISSQCALYLPVSNPVRLCLVFPSSPSICHRRAPSAHLLPLSYPRCLAKMADCEDMMEYFLSWWWISLLAERARTHTASEANARSRAHAERPMHHIKVSWVSVTVVSLISVGYHWRSRARTETKHSGDNMVWKVTAVYLRFCSLTWRIQMLWIGIVYHHAKVVQTLFRMYVWAW